MSNAPISFFCCVFLFLVGFGGGGRASAQTENFYAPVPAQGAFVQNIQYGPDPAEVLDVCRPVNGGPHPGLIMLHGGGWIHGDKKTMDDWCQAFARLGYVVADVDYRLFDPQAPRPDWPAFQIGDTQLAIRWMRAHARDLDFDPARLCAYGTSAGGYLAVFAGTMQTILPSDVATIVPTVPVGLSCVVDGYGPVDLTDPTYGTGAFLRLLGVSRAQNPDLYRDVSPLLHVNAQTAPTFVIHGNADTIVPIAQSEALVAAMQRAGVPVQMITYAGNHGYQGLDSAGLDNVFQQIAGYLKGRIGT